jgi:hypothetical protein
MIKIQLPDSSSGVYAKAGLARGSQAQKLTIKQTSGRLNSRAGQPSAIRTSGFLNK